MSSTGQDKAGAIQTRDERDKENRVRGSFRIPSGVDTYKIQMCAAAAAS